MNGSKLASIAIAALISLCAFASAAKAERSSEDVFSINTSRSGSRYPSAPGASARVTAGTASVPAPISVPSWFQAMDQAADHYSASTGDMAVISMPLNNEVERIATWTKTAAKIARNYRAFARFLRSTPIPSQDPELKQLRFLTADWYDDVAEVYEDAVRPRPVFKTRDDLDDCLQEISKRSQALKIASSSIKQMDSQLRAKYRVAEHHNAIADFTAGK